MAEKSVAEIDVELSELERQIADKRAEREKAAAADAVKIFDEIYPKLQNNFNKFSAEQVAKLKAFFPKAGKARAAAGSEAPKTRGPSEKPAKYLLPNGFTWGGQGAKMPKDVQDFLNSAEGKKWRSENKDPKIKAPLNPARVEFDKKSSK